MTLLLRLLTYQSKKSGQITGVTADIFEFIAKNSGLRFEFEAHNQTEALQLLQQGKISALALSDGDYLWDGRNNINSTLYYLRAPTSMITRYDSDKLEVIALPQGYQLSEAIKQQIHIIPSNTILLSKTVLTQFCTIKLMLPVQTLMLLALI